MSHERPHSADGVGELFDHAPCGLLACTGTGRITEVNHTLEQLAGLDRARLLDGRSFQDLLPAAGRIYFETHLAPVLALEGSITEIALELRREDGSRLPVLISATVSDPVAGAAAGFTMAVFQAEGRRRYEQGLLAESRRERVIASALADSLLSGQLPGASDLSVDVAYHPAVRGLEVGGDWYDAFWLEGPRRRVAITVGDVVGRGLAAAATMGQLRSATRALAGESRSPAQVLDALERYSRRHGIGQMTTVVYAEVDLDHRRLEFACAGHPPPLLLEPDGGARLLWDGRSLPLDTGMSSPGPRAQATVELPANATILLYSDGLIERRDLPDRDGLAYLEQLAAGMTALPAPELLSELAASLRDPGDPDDVCLLAAHLS